eukprot:TRINITY_DN12147_c0_g1_i1.p1 TRINITY_DN12147_c0_g1~~TRINITY_DN12147_c0_g1_i1.p1  ORF type:complete len:186 (+),score=44.30 TRINITY_DN12147_c0_g1_i1:406-963(+)
MLRSLIKKYKIWFASVLSELGEATAKLAADQCPEVKIETSLLLVDISGILREQFGLAAGAVIRALAKNLQHQRFKIRKVTLEAIGELLLCDKAGALYEHVAPQMSTIVLDKNNDVRKTAYEIIGRLLNGFSIATLRDFESQLVYLLIGGLSDEVDQIRADTIKLLDEVGLRRRALAEELGEDVGL